MTKFLNISTDDTLGGNYPENYIVSSQRAVKRYVDGKLDTKQNKLIAGDNITITEVQDVGDNKLNADCAGYSRSGTASDNLQINFSVWYCGVAYNGYMNTTTVSNFSNSKGYITFYSSDGSYGCAKFVKLKPNTQYTFSCENSTGKKVAVMCYIDNGNNTYKCTTPISYPTNIPYTFTTNQNEVYGILVYSPTRDTVEFNKMMLNEGNQSQTYEDYQVMIKNKIDSQAVDDNSTTSLLVGWSAQKLNDTIGDVETLINAL